MPKGTLSAAVNQLTEDVSTRVLGKRKLEDEDSVAVDNGVELFCDIFRRLLQGEWFDAWAMRAAMQNSRTKAWGKFCPGLVSGPR
jgi:hypothetical protein